MVVVAQLVRALDCGSRGRGFETHLPPKAQENSWAFYFGLFLKIKEKFERYLDSLSC